MLTGFATPIGGRRRLLRFLARRPERQGDEAVRVMFDDSPVAKGWSP